MTTLPAYSVISVSKQSEFSPSGNKILKYHSKQQQNYEVNLVNAYISC